MLLVVRICGGVSVQRAQMDGQIISNEFHVFYRCLDAVETKQQTNKINNQKKNEEEMSEKKTNTMSSKLNNVILIDSLH